MTEDFYEALVYFSNEVYQDSIMLNGILGPGFREFLQAKNKYYQLAIEALKEKI